MNRLVSIKDACDVIGVSRTTLWAKIRDGEFPRPIQVGPGRKAFLQSEIDEWITARVQERDAMEVA